MGEIAVGPGGPGEGGVMLTLETPLDAVTFAVVDVETTGLDPVAGDRVCEVAVVHGRAGAILDSWSTLVHPGRPISRGAQRVNNITNTMVRGAPPFAQVAPDLLARLEETVLVAHFAAFDLGFLNHELALLGLAPTLLPAWVVDTCAVARRRYRFKSNSLDFLSSRLPVRDARPAHRALADVLTTWNLLCWFLADLRARGVRLATLGDLLAVQGPLDTSPRQAFAVGPAPAPAGDVPPLLAQAIAGGHTLQARYMSADGSVSERRITPRQVTVERETLYVVAYCHLRNEERTFRLDRLEVWADARNEE